MSETILTPAIMSWVIWPLFIVLARIIDVSMGTVRVILIIRGLRYVASIIGFFEVMIWLVVITRVVKEINNPVCYIAYPLGFALGNYIGMLIEGKLSIGNVLIRVITRKEGSTLEHNLIEKNFHVTSIDAVNNEKPVKIIFSIISKKLIKEYLAVVKDFNPHAYYTIEDVKMIDQNGIPYKSKKEPLPILGKFLLGRKSK